MIQRVLVVDHVDSFTFNLVQGFAALGAEVQVRRADEVSVAEALELAPTHVVLSPGPGHPREAHLARELLGGIDEQVPILGVCLGHQVLGLAAGASVRSSARPEHGVEIRVFHDGATPFEGLSNPFVAGRYHSLTVTEAGLAPDFVVSAWSADGEVLGIRHRDLPRFGVQVHPESVLTPEGARLFQNFLATRAARVAPRRGHRREVSA